MGQRIDIDPGSPVLPYTLLKNGEGLLRQFLTFYQ